MSEDITTRLRRWTIATDAVPASDLMDEAADAIEKLRWRVMTLESAAKHSESRVTEPMPERASGRGNVTLGVSECWDTAYAVTRANLVAQQANHDAAPAAIANAESVAPQPTAGDRSGNPTSHSGTGHTHRSVEESSRPRRAHNPEIAGANPAAPTLDAVPAATANQPTAPAPIRRHRDPARAPATSAGSAITARELLESLTHRQQVMLRETIGTLPRWVVCGNAIQRTAAAPVVFARAYRSHRRNGMRAGEAAYWAWRWVQAFCF